MTTGTPPWRHLNAEERVYYANVLTDDERSAYDDYVQAAFNQQAADYFTEPGVRNPATQAYWVPPIKLRDWHCEQMRRLSPPRLTLQSDVLTPQAVYDIGRDLGRSVVRETTAASAFWNGYGCGLLTAGVVCAVILFLFGSLL